MYSLPMLGTNSGAASFFSFWVRKVTQTCHRQNLIHNEINIERERERERGEERERGNNTLVGEG